MNLNIIPNGAIKRVHVSQNDIGRTLTFELFNNSTSYTIPSGATVKIQGTKPSGFGFSETCTVSGNTVTVDTTEEMTDEYGYIEAELQIKYNGNTIGTSNFVLAVERNPHPSNTTDGTQITAQSLQVQINELAEIIESGGSGLTDGAKQALLNCFAHVAWIDEHGQDYYDALEDALYPPATLTSITCVYTQSGTVYDTDDLDDLKTDLVVTAHYDDASTATVTTYTLSGTLTVGTSTITVSYGGKTTTFDVTVVQGPLYPLATGVKTFTTQKRQASVYDGNIVKGELLANGSNDMHVNVAWLSLNGNTANDTNNNKVGTEKLFTIPAGANVSISVTPLTIQLQTQADGAKQTNLVMRDQTGTNVHTLLNTTTYNALTVGTPVTDSFTAESDIDVWNITMWMGSYGSDTITLELEIELTVDGTRYI